MAERFVSAVIGPRIGDQPLSTSVALGDPVYWDSGNSVWEQADATDETKLPRFICVGVHGFGATPYGTLALGALIQDSDATFTVDGVQYLSETAGAYTETRPTTAGSVSVELGRAVTSSLIAIQVHPASVSVAGYIENGTAGSPAITFESDPDTGIFRQAANTLGFSLGGTEELRYGTGAFNFRVATVISTTAGALTLTPATDVLISNGAGLVIGHTAQVTVGGALGELQLLGTAAADNTFIMGQWSADSGTGEIAYVKSRNAAIGSFTIVQADDRVGLLTGYADDGVDYTSQVAAIGYYIDGTPGANDTPGRIVLFTTPDGSATVIEALRITSTQTSRFTQSTDATFWQTFRSDTTDGAGYKLIKKVYDKDSALFDAAGTTDTVEVYAAEADSMIMAAWAVLDEQFTLNGDRTDLIVELGDNDADVDDVLDNAGNLSSDAVGTKYHTRGVLWAADEAPVIINRVIDATATLSGGATGNLASMSAGQITVYLLVFDWD